MTLSDWLLALAGMAGMFAGAGLLAEHRTRTGLLCGVLALLVGVATLALVLAHLAT